MSLVLEFIGLLNPMKWLEKLRTYRNRPKLRIYFDPKETYHLRRVVDANNSEGFFCHLVVANDGKLPAKGCRARVIGISVMDRIINKPVRHPGFCNPFLLKWAHEDFDPKDIENDIPKKIDLCYALESNPTSLVFFTHLNPDGNQKIYPPGVYQAKVRIDSENAKAVDGSFEIHFENGWNKISIQDLDSTASQ